MRLKEELEYVYQGIKLLTNVYRHKLSVIHLFVTNRCNSRCKICHIWAKQPKYDLPVHIIRNVLVDKSVSRYTFFTLGGGEFFLHPYYEKILELFTLYNRRFLLLTNGILSKKIIDAVRKFKIKHLYLSLDGRRETYKRVRGVDAYDNVVEVIDALHNETEILVAYCINPWNSYEDMLHVKELCDKKKVKFEVGLYVNPEYFETQLFGKYTYPEKLLPKDQKFAKLHNYWANSELKLPCWNIRTQVTIIPNCDVYLCQQKSVILGNLMHKSLSEIWNSPKTVETHKRYFTCNDCWLGCQRPFDVKIAYSLAKILPETLLNKMFGKYSWKKLIELLQDHGT